MEYWLAFNNGILLRSNACISLIILCLFITGCHGGLISVEEVAEVESHIISEQENNMTDNNLTEEYPYIDYDFIEQYHKILLHNIVTSPKDNYEDTVLMKYLAEYVEMDKQMMEAGSERAHPLTIDYHLFDFNDDGLEDYLVCLQGTFWSLYGRNAVMIYIQEKDATLRKVFEYYIHLHDGAMPDNHAPVAVLVERVENYHSLILPGTNALLRYDKEKRHYALCAIESHIDEDLIENEIHGSMSEEEYIEKKEMYEKIKHADMGVYIDYEFIEAKHEILRHNICVTPQNAYDNDTLKEILKDDIEDSRRLYEEGVISSPLFIDYFSFDFNDDGLEDYLTCYHGSGWEGSGGNHVSIYIQESDGSLSRVFSITMRLNESAWPNEHAPMAILNEKDDGYYAFVLVGTNQIMRYHEGKNRYEFT